MARNEEKAQSMLSRYLQSKKERDTDRRPYLATLCDDVNEAEKWRRQILGDIRRRVAEIQNPGLDETRLRELNDNINKLLRERGHWERRIAFLGGRNHERERKRRQAKAAEEWKDDVFEHNGYFYFGAARSLPGVQELIERQKGIRKESLRRAKEENSAALYRRVDIAYYGYLDDRDEGLEALETEAEEKRRQQLAKEWELKSSGGPDEPWNSSYVEFIGKKPPANPELDVQGLILERRKAEALEQLAAGVSNRE